MDWPPPSPSSTAGLAARIVFVTVRDEPPIVRKAIALGALGYVLKEDASEELLNAVRAAQAGQSYFSRSVRTDLL